MAAFPGSKVSRYLFFLFLLNGLILQPAGAEEESRENPVRWLERMNQSVLNLSYEGYFVYLNGKSLEAMRISHRIVDGEPRESLYTLTGTPREIIRDAHTITIVTQVDGKEKRIRQPSTGKLSPLKPLQPENLKDYYSFVMGQIARIAGRYGVVVMLVPSDDLRYGYRLVLDRQSALPLDLTVLDHAGERVSRIMFTDLRVTDAPKPDTGTTSSPPAQPVSMTAVGIVEKEVGGTATAEARNTANGSSWEFRGLPAGFRMVSYQRVGTGLQEHFVFSDGLATISAYLEPLAEGDRPFDGETSLGSINALGRHIDGQQLTVVGEVPHKTLRLVASALRHKE
jgi:sigma-E factor negative regulatory protein RseB